MSSGVRHLTVIGEFKPFGLIVEELDGKPPEKVTDIYNYFLFDPEVTRQTDEYDEFEDSNTFGDGGDHELFIRGNRILWSIGSRVHKRFTSASPVIMACWCRMGDQSEALLCVLHTDCLTTYNISGETVSVPLPRPVASIWPLPFGLLLQVATEANSLTCSPFSSSSPSLIARDILRAKIDTKGYSPQNVFNYMSQYDSAAKGDGAFLSSHLILRDPLAEPHSTYIDERGKLCLLKEFDERTIWTSNRIPLMATYNKGKMQHSLWVAELGNSVVEVKSSKSSVPAEVFPKQLSFRRIWQGKGAQSAASKIFLATDDDVVPIICFLLQEQKKLVSVRLQTVDLNNEILFDIKPDMSWSIPAISAVPITVTRPRVKVGVLPHQDIISLASHNTLCLYSGKQCLCRFILPPSLGTYEFPHNLKPRDAASMSQDVKIVGLSHSVEGRFNVTVNNGQIFRCAIRRSPSSSLTNDCITAMAEGLDNVFYNHFLVLLWGDVDLGYLSKNDVGVESEWEAFCSTITKLCSKSKPNTQMLPDSVSCSSWDFLINSKFHKNY